MSANAPVSSLQILKEIEDSLRPDCFGYYHPDAADECDKMCDFTSQCRYYQVSEVLILEVYALEYEEAIREEIRNIDITDMESGGDPIEGRSFVFTGHIQILEEGKPLNRQQYEARIKQREGFCPSRISKSAPPDFLVQASSQEQAGVETAKMKTARQLGIKVLSEKEFLAMYYFDQPEKLKNLNLEELMK